MTATLYAGLNRLEPPDPTPIDLAKDDLERDSPEWWFQTLLVKLDARAKLIQKFEDYYNGNQPLEFATKKFRAAFGDLFGEFCANYCALVVDAVAERLVVQGFRMGADDDDDDQPAGPSPEAQQRMDELNAELDAYYQSGQRALTAGIPGYVTSRLQELMQLQGSDDDDGPDSADADAWRFWQANQMDLQSRMGHVEALIKSVAYIHVSPFKDDWPADDTPLMTVEDPLQVYVEVDAANPRKRVAALKKWLGEDQYVHAVVYLPEQIYKYRSEDKLKSGQSMRNMRWVPEILPGEEWPLANPVGQIFFVPLYNRLRIGGQTSSEIAEAVRIQDAINKELSDMLLASEFAAFPQKWVTNFTLETDPNTGKPIEPWNLGVDRMMVAPPRDGEDAGEAETKFGQFDAADLKQWVAAIEHLIQELASITRTPPHYLLGSMGTFPSGESLRAAETGLVTKAKERMLSFGEAWEEAVVLAFKVLKDQRGDIVDSETIWKDPETKTEAEHTDSLIKLSAMGVPLEQLWLDAGYSPVQIKRFKRMLKEQASWGATANVNITPTSVPGPAPAGPPPSVPPAVPPTPPPAPAGE